MQWPFKKEMHNPQNGSTKFVVGQRHGRTGKRSPAATKLQREMVKSKDLEITFTKQQGTGVLFVSLVFFFSRIV